MPANDGERRVLDDDGGVARRLARRSRTASAVLLVVGVAVLVVVLLLPSGLVTVLAALLAVVVIAIGAVLAVRGLLWAGVDALPVPVAGGTAAVIGPPTHLSPVRPGAPLRRKLGAKVVPIRTADGPQPGGGALLVHARSDGEALVADDRVRVWLATRRKFGPLENGRPTDLVRGRFILRRDSDGALFLATTRLSDVL